MRFLIFLLICITLPVQAHCHYHSTKTRDDKKQIIRLEHTWLNNLHNKTALDSILAHDFGHPLPDGTFITKEQHIGWAASHPSPEDYNFKFHTKIKPIKGFSKGIQRVFIKE